MPAVDQVRFGTTSRSTALTCAVGGRDHLVSDHATAAGLAAGHGEYVAVCGHRVLAAPMAAPQGPSCLDCETALHRITTDRTALGSTGRARRRRRGVMARLLRRRLRPAHAQSGAARHRLVKP